MSDSPAPDVNPYGTEFNEFSLDSDFVEQAEYIPEADFLAFSAEHPDEESIIRRLSTGGAKLLVGPRGCGKTTLMLKAYYRLLRSENSTTLPIYVNFKLSLKLEPLYVNTPNATFWFRQWLNLKIYEGLYKSIRENEIYDIPRAIISEREISRAIKILESGNLNEAKGASSYTIEELSDGIMRVLEANDLSRCVLLLDDAAHAFSPRQQEDFFEFFRQVKSREISPKAAIYPGITTNSPTFHVGHDAEQIDVWVRPDRSDYIGFMTALAEKRFRGELPSALANTTDALNFLAYASFGIPRSFLNMLRAVYQDHISAPQITSTLDRRKLLQAAQQGKESAHNVYDSLSNKLPAYRDFVNTGNLLYGQIIENLKNFNKTRNEDDQALEIGLKKPVPPEMEKVLSFFQYAGILMPAGVNSRGIKGTFELYMVHFGDLITENAIVGRRTKSITSFVRAFSAQTHQAWPRISPETLVKGSRYPELFRLSLPNCQQCGTERASQHAKFCQNCGAPLKTSSIYEELTNQDISVLPLSNRIITRIKRDSQIRTIKDILIDSNRTNLRGIAYIGPVRAARIASYAEEYVA
ncbi:hypothetical protein [Methylobacterium trifolii]|uniref:Zinc ribbon domain-containing protein n=1 Tax=Methylobacterium trifolii TaxID=1003092 RepID=A0ABQ4U787_9HYPH|nr:hypothetical protein [Methylobacterium trifolii]GJE62742.1 hypothetical protein MPOCJGCO_4877 [Methylobacterium trifolii]